GQLEHRELVVVPVPAPNHRVLVLVLGGAHDRADTLPIARATDEEDAEVRQQLAIYEPVPPEQLVVGPLLRRRLHTIGRAKRRAESRDLHGIRLCPRNTEPRRALPRWLELFLP